MATETPNIKLKLIEDIDTVTQDLINANSLRLEDELTTLGTNITTLTNNIGNVGSKQVDETSRKNGASLVWDAASDKYKHVVITGGVGGAASAADVSNAPAGNLLSENVQDALNELDTKKASIESLVALETDIGLKADKTYVDENFYTKSAADTKFLELTKYDRTRAMMFSADGQILRYPWAGEIKQVQANCSTAKTADIPFYLEKMSKADYDAGGTTWARISGTDYAMYLLANDIYVEYVPTTATTIAVNDLVKITVVGTAVDHFMVQVLVENTLPV